tara:strand:+ start:1217 stop:1792 length:576 start_codon:yes stop_codon:yes gene_type:complete
MVKLYYVRHGHSFHNELYEKIGEKAYMHPSVKSSSLTSKGIEQTNALKQEIIDLKIDIDLILVSPLDRCLQTVEYIIKDTNKTPEIISLDEMIEYEISDMANYRKDKSELMETYPFVNFKYINDIFVSPNEDNIDLLKKRIKSFNHFLSLINKNSYSTILIVGHTSWLNMLLFNKVNSSDLEHCKVYDFNN